jgi:hypothetical protein
MDNYRVEMEYIRDKKPSDCAEGFVRLYYGERLQSVGIYYQVGY